MRTIDGIGSWVLIFMALASVISMIAAFRLDLIVHGDLYNYGLQFSEAWANPYWIAIRLILAMCCFSVTASVAFQIYKFKVLKDLKSEGKEQKYEISVRSDLPELKLKEKKRRKTAFS